MALKKVLITGVSGIVGSSAYLHMCTSPDKYELYGLGRRRVLSDRVRDRRDIDMPEDRYSVCTLDDYDAVARAVEGMDAVVHMAADPGGGDWNSLLHSNIIGAYNVFEACHRAGVARVIAASTIQVSNGHRAAAPYNAVGQGRLEPLPEGVDKISAQVPAEPRNLYASTKVFGESLCRTYSHTRGMSCLAIRIGWVVAEDRPRHRRAVDIWCSQRDIAGLIQACVDAPEEVRFAIFYGMSNNDHCWLDLSNARELLGFVPQDRAEDYLDQIPK